MFQRIAEFDAMLSGTDQWRPRVYGDVGPDGFWEGWIVFFPIAGGPVISTPRETTQGSYQALSQWALTLDNVYLEGALARARTASAGVEMPTALSDLATLESRAAADAVALHRAAERAGIDAASANAEADMHERAAAVARAKAAEFAREREEIEELADETTRAGAETEAATHEAAVREARAGAADAGRRKTARKRNASPRRRKRT